MSELKAVLVSDSFRSIVKSQKSFKLPFFKSSVGILYNSYDVSIDEINAIWKFSTKFSDESTLQLHFEINKNKADGCELNQLKDKSFNVVVRNDATNIFTSAEYYLQPAKLFRSVKISIKENTVILLNVTVSISDCNGHFIDRNAMCKKIASNNINILNDPTYSDFTFIVKGKEFKVHKNILAAASPVFVKLFTSNMRESLENKCEVIDIEDSIFEHMLRFIYGAVLPPDIKNISVSLYEAAHYYDIKDLMNICKNIIRSNLSTVNAHEIYAWAILYDIQDLKGDAAKHGNIAELSDNANGSITSSTVIEKLIAQKETDLAMLKRIDRKRKCVNDTEIH